MDSSASNRFDIFEIYRQYCDVRLRNAYSCGEVGYRQDDESQRAKFSKEALAQLSKFIESGVHGRISIFDEIFKLMSRLNLMVDFSEFSRLYDFIFFMCRETGQKNISVSRAVTAWRLVLAGRFRLLNQWCDFVEKNQRHNISEDTWQQVLAFSRCVHANLEGYDPEGAWPVLIDDFVEHMYRISGANHNPNCSCTCSETQSDDTHLGSRIFPDSKRKLPDDFQEVEMEISDPQFPDSTCPGAILSCKRSRHTSHKTVNWGDNPAGPTTDDCMDIVKHSSPLRSSKSLCAVEGCLSKGFAGLFSNRSYLQFGRERLDTYTEFPPVRNIDKYCKLI